METIDLKNCINLKNKYSEFFATQLTVGAAVFKKCGDDYRLLKIVNIISKKESDEIFASMEKQMASDNVAKYLSSNDEYFVEFSQ